MTLSVTLSAAPLTRHGGPDARSFDAVIDVVGGSGWQARLAALRPGGRSAAIGAADGPLVQGDLRAIYQNDLTLCGCTHQPREVFTGLVTMIATAHVRPVVSNIYPLRALACAQADLADGRDPAKLALTPEASDP